MRLSSIVFALSLAYGAGIFFASFLFSSPYIVLFLAWAGIALLCVFWRQTKPAYLAISFLAAAFGVFSYSSAASLPEAPQLKETSFVGTVVGSPERNEQNMQVVVQLKGDIEGRILLFAPFFEDVRQGDRVRVTGELQTPTSFEDFNYPLFLAKEGIFWVVFRPEIEVLQQGGPFLSTLRENLLRNIQAHLSPPESSLLSAMLLGDSAQLPEEFAQQLSVTGTRHITAVSGMHVAILSGMLFVFLLGAGFTRKASCVLALVFLLFFILITGAPASAVRAGIMGSAMLVGGITGRRNVSLRALVFAGAGMLSLNPLLLGHDIGFQLSFLAVLGILLFLPVFQHFLGRVQNPLGLRDVLSMSVAAQLF
ncbi:MAG: ComEC/Rec2 family competence protein, partial [bacterium]|nr:ComEC/Rec2 family competence protein [bacterium]